MPITDALEIDGKTIVHCALEDSLREGLITATTLKDRSDYETQKSRPITTLNALAPNYSLDGMQGNAIFDDGYTCEFSTFLEKQGILYKLELGIIDKNDNPLYPLFPHIGRAQGTAMQASLCAVTYKPTSSTQRVSYTSAGPLFQELPYGEYGLSTVDVLTALLHNELISDVAKKYAPHTHPFRLYVQGEQQANVYFHLFNPTQERVLEAACEFQEFLRYVQEYKTEIDSAAHILNIAKIIDHIKKTAPPALGKKLDDDVKSYIEDIDKVLSGIPRRDNSKLADKALKALDTGAYSWKPERVHKIA